MRDVGIPLGLVLVTAAFGSACTGDGEAPGTETDAMPIVATVTATDYAFEAPDTLQEGWTTFRLVNNGDRLHAALLVKLEQGGTLDEFQEAYSQAREAGGPWDALGLRGGLVAPPPRESTNATLYLAPGHYLWYCPMNFEGGVPHVLDHDMARPFVVTQRQRSAPIPIAPEPTVTITMVDYAFGLSAPLTAGQHVIRVENQGLEGHEVILMRLAPGKTLEDIQIWLGDPRGPPPISSSVGGVVLEEAGAEEAYFEAELMPGDYVLLCTLTAPDGRSHSEHGMILQIRVN
jgi:hypothetical protein